MNHISPMVIARIFQVAMQLMSHIYWDRQRNLNVFTIFFMFMAFNPGYKEGLSVHAIDNVSKQSFYIMQRIIVHTALKV